MNLSTTRFVPAKPGTNLDGHVFRVVFARNKDLVLWSELGDGVGSGMTWTGDTASFCKTFAALPDPPPPTPAATG